MMESELARNPSSKSLAGSVSMASFYGATPDLGDQESHNKLVRQQHSHSSLSFLKTAKSEAMDMLHNSYGQHYFIKRDAWGDDIKQDFDSDDLSDGGIGTTAKRHLMIQKKSQQQMR